MYLYCISLKERHFWVLIIGFMIVYICDGMVGSFQISVNVFIVQGTSAVQVIIYLSQWLTAYITYYCRCFSLCVWVSWGLTRPDCAPLGWIQGYSLCSLPEICMGCIYSSEIAKTNQKSPVSLKAFTWSWSTIILTQHTIDKAWQTSKVGINGSGRGTLPVGGVGG